MESQFPGNQKMPKSNPPQAPERAADANEKRVEAIVGEGEVIIKKPSLSKRFAKTFFSGEAPKSVVSFVFQQVLVPAARDMVFQAGREALQRVLYPGGAGSDGRSAYSQNGPIVSYNRFSAPVAVRAERTTVSHQARTTQSFDELVFPSRTQAEAVIDEMLVLLKKYGHVTIGDFFDLSGVTPEYTDRNYGWKDLRGVVPLPCNGGYQLNLPRPEIIRG